MSRPARQRKPSAALRFLEQSETQWEAREKELAATAPERRKARLERERAKKREEREAEKAKERAIKAKQREKERAKKQRERQREKERAAKRRAKEREKAAKAKAKAKAKAAKGPKRAKSAYLYFTLENREDVKAENPEATFGEISKILGDEWRSLTADERAYFDGKAAEDQARYEAEVKKTRKRKPSAKPKSPKAAKPAKKPKKKTPVKKKAVKKSPAPPKPPSTYFEFCAEAIGALRERSGSSYAAIEKFITSNHSEVDFKRHHFRAALKKGVADGNFIKVKASFKLADSMKKRWYQ